MKNMTVRNIPSDLAIALETEKRNRGKSLNQTVIDLLRHSLGLTHGSSQTNGLKKLAGAWTEEEYKEFETAIAGMETIDDELWQ